MDPITAIAPASSDVLLGAVTNTAPDLIERTASSVAEAARANPYVTAAIGATVAGFAAYKAAEYAWPTIRDGWNYVTSTINSWTSSAVAGPTKAEATAEVTPA